MAEFDDELVRNQTGRRDENASGLLLLGTHERSSIPSLRCNDGRWAIEVGTKMPSIGVAHPAASSSLTRIESEKTTCSQSFI